MILRVIACIALPFFIEVGESGAIGVPRDQVPAAATNRLAGLWIAPTHADITI
ncbi:hypothetical protein BURKHO8Y_120235 [Burkholderia sp. 8Y]|uniref:hypothetical protein n=1 Tax=Burkholderia sp. 8Y TaxID=2653133 RepID=UPI0012EFB257|nr:hypothetical protein [Burkholderia sp. 8Y]VXB42318.1 hypothetical protein BURKHO8Y_120235 [Burkholderia sp. 8Y]